MSSALTLHSIQQYLREERPYLRDIDISQLRQLENKVAHVVGCLNYLRRGEKQITGFKWDDSLILFPKEGGLWRIDEKKPPLVRRIEYLEREYESLEWHQKHYWKLTALFVGGGLVLIGGMVALGVFGFPALLALSTGALIGVLVGTLGGLTLIFVSIAAWLGAPADSPAYIGLGLALFLPLIIIIWGLQLLIKPFTMLSNCQSLIEDGKKTLQKEIKWFEENFSKDNLTEYQTKIAEEIARETLIKDQLTPLKFKDKDLIKRLETAISDLADLQCMRRELEDITAFMSWPEPTPAAEEAS